MKLDEYLPCASLTTMKVTIPAQIARMTTKPTAVPMIQHFFAISQKCVCFFVISKSTE